MKIALVASIVLMGYNISEFVASFKTVNEKIEVEVIESDYAFGTYLVITGAQTEFLDCNGNKIDKTKRRIYVIFFGKRFYSLIIF